MTSEVTKPLAVAPEVSKPAATSAADTNGATATVNGTGDNFQPVVPEESKQSSAPVADASTDKAVAPVGAPTTSDAAGNTSDSAQPPVMTGALPSGDQSEAGPAPIASIEPTQEDGVKDVPATTTKPVEQGVNGNDENGIEKEGTATDENKDVDMKDAAPTRVESSTEQKDVDMKDSGPTAATISDGTGVPSTSGAASPADGEEATGEKRKAEAGTNGTAADKEPAEKKQKGLADKVVTKAKDVVEEVKEKATPARKNSKKGKKEPAAVGRTERKTRSQGRAE